ncbi:MAG: ATP-binding cassette domain-containing protein [Desulfobulbaceae bacterium]|nr:ATP-binding cassette domain-containing protein [Desulfobulbaceae bacterium]
MKLNAYIQKKMHGFTIDLSFCCQPGELLALVGPSGAGKTTIIRMLAGLEQPDKATITNGNTVWLDTKQGIELSPGKRKLGYVFQEFSLFPHLNVEKNVAFGTKNQERVESLLRLFGIHHLRKRAIKHISGGERQRTALAQALAPNPRVLLLDEPFSALDPITRKKMRTDLARHKNMLHIPIILVTHDLEEAHFLADTIVPVVEGKHAPLWPELCPSSVRDDTSKSGFSPFDMETSNLGPFPTNPILPTP